jgi:DNA polymerase (family 10)
MLQERGERSGVQLTPDGLVKSGRPVPASTEADAYALLDLPFIIPELRQGTDEIDDPPAGAAGRFVEFGDIRGDLHMHTTFSDGRDGLEAMVAACVGIGYEYIAICDHSQSSAASRTMSEDDLARQGEEIDVLQERYPAIRILKGAEVDILPDGRLDFSDRALGRLDVVLASLHDRAGHGPDRLLRRYRAAAEHPLVSILTHPANRLVGRYDGYDLDFEALFDLAARTGTLLEVDGAPSHLDLDGSLARAAVEAGVLLAIDSDCHHARLLEAQMRLGIGTARRGRVQPPHVVNSRPVREALRLLQRKRAATV